MKWNEIKTLVSAFFQSFALPFMQQNEPEFRPVAVKVEPHRRDQQRY